MISLSNPIFLLVTGGIVLTVGDVMFKLWAESPNPALYTAGLLVYLFGLTFLAQSFKYENIAVASALFVIFNILSLLLVSWIYFDEKISLLQMIGLLLAIASILLLEIGKSS